MNPLRYIIPISVLWRVAISLLTHGFFQPDEYFQSLEVAHDLVFGYGHLTWEWVSEPPIRSIIFPAIYSSVYWALKIMGLDDRSLIIYGPRLLQGILAALTDVYVCELARKVVGERYVLATYFLSMTSFFHILSLGRTLSNSLETSLTTVALSYWPWSGSDSSGITKPLAVAAVACLVRPTNAIIWAFLSFELAWRKRSNPEALRSHISQVLAVGLTALSSQLLADTLYFGRVTLTPLNFLQRNLSSVSLFYGINTWHYYLTQALPILCTTLLPFFLLSCWQVSKKGLPAEKRLLCLIVWTITIYSMAGHKEWRFIHPLLPAMHVLSARIVVDFCKLFVFTKDAPRKKKGTPRSGTSPYSDVSKKKLVLGLLLLPIGPAIYIVFFHGRAQINVMHHLRTFRSHPNFKTVGFLMPCHSTPTHSYLHDDRLAEPGQLWTIGCEPPLGGQNLTTYRDQTDVFYESPSFYLLSRFPSKVNSSFPASPTPSTTAGNPNGSREDWKHEWPSHFVFFEALIHDQLDGKTVKLILSSKGYKEVWRSKNGWEEDSRRRGDVLLWEWTQQ